MKKLFLFFFIFIIISKIFASDSPVTVAFEFQEKGKFSGIIGKAYIKDTTIEIVTFAELDDEIIPFAYIYTILEKQNQVKGLYNIKCKNQLGVTSTGTIDMRDRLNPKITLISDTGIILTNISEGGRKMKDKYLPKVNLGK